MIVWGVDPSTRRVSIAWAGDQQGVATRSFDPDLTDGARLWHVYASTHELCRTLPRPTLVLVEQPFGAHVAPVSYLVMGAIMLACYRVTGADVQPVPPPRWKQLALGHGNPRIDGDYKLPIMRWAQAHGYTGGLQDEADAWAIAHAALKSASAPAGI